jgi:hypothetical protein
MEVDSKPKVQLKTVEKISKKDAAGNTVNINKVKTTNLNSGSGLCLSPS